MIKEKKKAIWHPHNTNANFYMYRLFFFGIKQGEKIPHKQNDRKGFSFLERWNPWSIFFFFVQSSTISWNFACRSRYNKNKNHKFSIRARRSNHASSMKFLRYNLYALYIDWCVSQLICKYVCARLTLTFSWFWGDFWA